MSESSFTEIFRLEGKKGRTLSVYSDVPPSYLCGDKSLGQWVNERVHIAIPKGDYDLAKGMLAPEVTRFKGNEEHLIKKLPGDSRKRTYVVLERSLVDYVTLIDSAEKYSLLHPRGGRIERESLKKEQNPRMSDALRDVQRKWTTPKHSRFNRNRPSLGALL